MRFSYSTTSRSTRRLDSLAAQPPVRTRSATYSHERRHETRTQAQSLPLAVAVQLMRIWKPELRNAWNVNRGASGALLQPSPP